MGAYLNTGAWLLAMTASLFCVAAPPSHAAGPTSLEISAGSYSRVREALIESIEDEGLLVSSVSGFGAMLERTEPDLGHRGNIYRNAEVFAFCSVRIAATLVRENPDNIALCPLSIGIYELKSQPGKVKIVYRTPATGTPGDDDAQALLARITERARTSSRTVGMDDTVTR